MTGLQFVAASDLVEGDIVVHKNVSLRVLSGRREYDQVVLKLDHHAEAHTLSVYFKTPFRFMGRHSDEKNS